MPYETPITVRQALTRIESGDYVLPAIQREFVWDPGRITKLFDSLMRGYPIGGFLLWRLEAETVKELDLYQFMDRYNEFNYRHNERLTSVDARPLHAVLDGQQRLTALNIGLRGSYAYRLPRRWLNNPENYPKRHLHIELCEFNEDEDDATEDAYRFEFLIEGEAAKRNSETAHWFRVPDILKTSSIAEILATLQAAELTDEPLNRAIMTIERLQRVVNTDLVIASHVEEEQKLDRVLEIFIRVNSGGVTLSSSDLLLSIATARWKDRDARETIYGLVDELNGIGHGFAFTKDQVLKASLLVTDAPDIRFKAANINKDTMSKVEEGWDGIDRSMKLAAKALSSFGFSSQNLTAHSVALPLADWFHQMSQDSSWLTSQGWADDRARVRRWVLQTLLKQGVWGSGLDTLLRALRTAMRDAQGPAFPVAALESAFDMRGKSLVWSEAEIDALASVEFGKRAFGVLAAIYPGFDGTKSFHVDHIFPSALFTKSRLKADGLSDENVERAIELRNGVANLQLLEQGEHLQAGHDPIGLDRAALSGRAVS